MDPEKLLADDKFELHVGIGDRHEFLKQLAGFLHDGERSEDDLTDLFKRFRDKFCEVGKED